MFKFWKKEPVVLCQHPEDYRTNFNTDTSGEYSRENGAYGYHRERKVSADLCLKCGKILARRLEEWGPWMPPPFRRYKEIITSSD